MASTRTQTYCRDCSKPGLNIGRGIPEFPLCIPCFEKREKAAKTSTKKV